jgi:hypothetical protein
LLTQNPFESGTKQRIERQPFDLGTDRLSMRKPIKGRQSLSGRLLGSASVIEQTELYMIPLINNRWKQRNVGRAAPHDNLRGKIVHHSRVVLMPRGIDHATNRRGMAVLWQFRFQLVQTATTGDNVALSPIACSLV